MSRSKPCTATRRAGRRCGRRAFLLIAVDVLAVPGVAAAAAADVAAATGTPPWGGASTTRSGRNMARARRRAPREDAATLERMSAYFGVFVCVCARARVCVCVCFLFLGGRQVKVIKAGDTAQSRTRLQKIRLSARFPPPQTWHFGRYVCPRCECIHWQASAQATRQYPQRGSGVRPSLKPLVVFQWE